MSDRFSNLELGETTNVIEAAPVATINRNNFIEFGEGRGKAPAPNPNVFIGVGEAGKQAAESLMRGVKTLPDFSKIHPSWMATAKPFNALKREIDGIVATKKDFEVDESLMRVAQDSLRVADMDDSLISGMPFTNTGLMSIVRLLSPTKNLSTTLVSDVIDEVKRAKDPKCSERERAIAAEGVRYLSDKLNLRLDLKDERWRNKKVREEDDSRILKVRTREIEGMPHVRMVGSDRYLCIDNDLVMDLLVKSFDMLGKDISKCFTSHTHSDGDNMNFNILVPDSLQSIDGDSEYSVGIAVKNSEVGYYRYTVAAFLFRWICLNGNIWGRVESEITVNQKHVGKTLNIPELLNDTTKAVSAGLSHGHDLLTQMGYTRQWELPKLKGSDSVDAQHEVVARHILALSKQYHLTAAESRAWFKGWQWEGGNTAQAIVNGLSAAARDAHGEQKWNMQKVSGSIIAPKLDSTLDKTMEYWRGIGDDAMNSRYVKKEDVSKLLVKVGMREP